MDLNEAARWLLQYVRRQLTEATVDLRWATDLHNLNLPVLHVDFPERKPRYLAVSRSLIDHCADVAQLQGHMESYDWQREMRDANSEKRTLGDHGWEESDWNFGKSIEG